MILIRHFKHFFTPNRYRYFSNFKQTLKQTRKIFLDTETTGLNHKKDRILSICAKEYTPDNKFGVTWSCFLNPGPSIHTQHPKAYESNRLDITDLKRNNVCFHDISDSFLNFVKNSKIICHNASFDIHFINSELFRNGKQPLQNNIFCTLKLARKLYPAQKNTLDALCDRYKISRLDRIKNGHSAVLDTELLSQVYLELIKKVHHENNFQELLNESEYFAPQNKWIL